MIKSDYKDKESAIGDGWIFVTRKTVKYINCDGYTIAKVVLSDVSGTNSFGYNFELRLVSSNTSMWHQNQTLEVLVSESEFKTLSVGGAIYTNCVRSDVLNKSLENAKELAVKHYRSWQKKNGILEPQVRKGHEKTILV